MSSEPRSLAAREDGAEVNQEQKKSGLAWATVVLILGDAVMFLLFSISGRQSHGEAAGLDAIWQVISTAAPFALAWFLVSPFMGAYRRRLQAAPGQMALRTVLAWLAAWPLAMLLRILITQRVPAWTFFVVSLLSILVFLEIWRVAFAWVNTKRR